MTELTFNVGSLCGLESIADFPMVVIHKEYQKIISGSGYNDRSVPKNGLYEIGIESPPQKITIKGHAVDLNKAFKSQQTRYIKSKLSKRTYLDRFSKEAK